MRELPRSTWPRVIPYALVGALLIGIPSDIIDTPIFQRPVPLRTVDYVIWAISSLLIGLIFAIRVDDPETEQDTKPIWGGFASFLAVGCPVCNQAVVALVGTSGALNWWAPVQPVVGLAAIGLLIYALHKRLVTYQLTTCPLPATQPTDSEQPSQDAPV